MKITSEVFIELEKAFQTGVKYQQLIIDKKYLEAKILYESWLEKYPIPINLEAQKSFAEKTKEAPFKQ